MDDQINLPDDIRVALEKAHQYFQPHHSSKSTQYRNDAKETVDAVLRIYTPDFDKWEHKRIRKQTIGLLEIHYKSK